MTCKEIRDVMPDVAAGLNPGGAAMETHLASCGECAARLEEMRQTMALMDEWAAPEPSAYFDVRLQAKLREEMARPRVSWFEWLRKPALAAALTLLLAVGVTLYRSSDTPGAGKGTSGPVALLKAEPGTAVGDLQMLDKNDELYANFDVLDELQVQRNVSANP